jgi:hypothetical protein
MVGFTCHAARLTAIAHPIGRVRRLHQTGPATQSKVGRGSRAETGQDALALRALPPFSRCLPFTVTLAPFLNTRKKHNIRLRCYANRRTCTLTPKPYSTLHRGLTRQALLADSRNTKVSTSSPIPWTGAL